MGFAAQAENPVLRAVDYLAGALPKLAVVPGSVSGSSGGNLGTSGHAFTYPKKAASQTGSMRNWNPRPVVSDAEAIRDRETITGRVIDLVGSDPHAAGLVDKFPITVIGNGLTPYPSLDAEILGITEDQALAIENQQRLIWTRWSPYAAAGMNMTMGEIQFVWERCLVQFNEAFTVVVMDNTRPGYRMCLRPIHPLRVKTPLDKRGSGNIIDGIETGDNGEPLYGWVKMSDPRRVLPDLSVNFVRIPFRIGHRFGLIHDFFKKDPEQYRGVSPMAPILKGLRDLGDFFDAELVSNVVTAAFAMFIELQNGTNPTELAGTAASFYDTRKTASNKTEYDRYNEIQPGAIMYGNRGEKPHAIAASRPGATFEPFVREIKKSFAHAYNLTYPVAFNDTDGASFAVWRSAMLEAWRVFMWHRAHAGETSQKPRKMLMEEAFLRGDLEIPGGAARFYKDMDAFCACSWYGAPKGDIEPYKAIKADLLKNDANVKTKEKIILESGETNPKAVIRQVEREKKDEIERGIRPANTQAAADPETNSPQAAGVDYEALAEAVADELDRRT